MPTNISEQQLETIIISSTTPTAKWLAEQPIGKKTTNCLLPLNHNTTALIYSQKKIPCAGV